MPGLEFLTAPCYSFLIKHENQDAKSKYDTMLFDLGVRKDLENSPKAIQDMAASPGTYGKSVTVLLLSTLQAATASSVMCLRPCLRVRENTANSSALINVGVVIDIEKEVIDVLKDNGEDPGAVGGIIWSHWHFVSILWRRC